MSLNEVEEVKNLSQSQVNKLSNSQLKTALMTMLRADHGDPSNAVLLNEIRQVKREIEDIKNVKQEVVELSAKLDQAFKIIHQQQMFLESIDAKDRQKKLIITGISEVTDDIGGNDQQRIKSVLNRAGYTEDFDCSNWNIKRLGQINPNRTRPILLVVESQERRNAILDKVRNLKNEGPVFSRIYVKKDTHPAVRKELGRLRRREKEERDRPENQGTNIRYDAKERVLLRDGVIIDRYAPSFF